MLFDNQLPRPRLSQRPSCPSDWPGEQDRGSDKALAQEDGTMLTLTTLAALALAEALCWRILNDD